MSQSVNQVTLVGRLGADPDMKTVNGQTPLCMFSVATTSEFKDRNGGEQQKTEWHRVTVWGAQARPCAQYLHKGDRVCVLGALRYGEYEQNGVKMKSVEIVARDVVFLADRPNGQNSQPPQQQQAQSGWGQPKQQQPVQQPQPGWGPPKQQAPQQQPQPGWGQPQQQYQPQPGWGAPMDDVQF